MQLILIAHNIRSIYNIGAILRTCDGFGVSQVYATGYTSYPATAHDPRPPHERTELTRRLHKTALGAEQYVSLIHHDDPIALIQDHRAHGFTIAALEQADSSIALPDYKPPQKLLLILGEEVHGVPSELLDQCDVTLEIPMSGQKESFNVSVAAGIALYALVATMK